MEPDQEMPALALSATGLAVVDAPTAVQVMWLVLTALAIAVAWARRHGFDGSGGSDGERGRRAGPHPPFGVM